MWNWSGGDRARCTSRIIDYRGQTVADLAAGAAGRGQFFPSYRQGRFAQGGPIVETVNLL